MLVGISTCVAYVKESELMFGGRLALIFRRKHWPASLVLSLYITVVVLCMLYVCPSSEHIERLLMCCMSVLFV
jgi:hypothetical protein